MFRQKGARDHHPVTNPGQNPIGLAVATLVHEAAAMEALHGLRQHSEDWADGSQPAALLRKDERGRFHIKETADVGSGELAILSGVLGAAVGAIAGPSLVAPAAVGALIGGLAARLRDSDFSSQRLSRLGRDLMPSNSVILVASDLDSTPPMERHLREAGADVFVDVFNSEIAGQLEAGHQVAYTALITREGFVFGRPAEPSNAVGGMVIADDPGLTLSKFLATEKGFAIQAIEVTDDGTSTVPDVSKSGEKPVVNL